MRKKKLFTALATTLSLFVACQAEASRYIECDSCNAAQMSAAAIGQGVGRYVVGNVTTGNVDAYRVYRSTAPQIVGGSKLDPELTTNLYVDDGNITSYETAGFQALVRFYHAAPVGYQKQYILQIVPAGTATSTIDFVNDRQKPGVFHPMSQPSPGTARVTYPATGENVYSFVNSGAAQNGMLNWVGKQTVLGINSTFSNLVNSSVLHTFTGTAPNVYVTVIFTDGSHIGVYVDLTQSPPALMVNEASAVDSHGNNVPANATAVTGSGRQVYNFSGNGNVSDQGNMAGQIGSFGINVPVTGYGYACVGTPGLVTCTPYYPE